MSARICTAHSSRTGMPCRAVAMQGQLVCVKHGGSSPQARAAAERRIAEHAAVEAATRAVRKLGLPQDVDPAQALLNELHQTAGIVAWLRGEIDQAAGAADDIAAIVDTAAWRTWHEQRTHLARVAAECVKVGIAERQVALEEARVEAVVGVLRGVLARLGVDPGSPAAVEAVTAELRALG